MCFLFHLDLKVQSFKLYNNKYIISSTQITNTEIFYSSFLFTEIAIIVCKLLSLKVLFVTGKKI